MHFKFLAEIAHELRSEEGRSSADRGPRLLSLESNLRVAKTNLEQAIAEAKAAANAPANGPRSPTSPHVSVAQKRQLFEAVSRRAQIQELRAEVARQRRHLINQGAILDGSDNIRWGESASTVFYDRDLAARNLTKMSFVGGRVCDRDLRPIDTTTMSTVFSGLGQAIYVMSEEGNIHFSTHIVGNRYHSSLLAGSNVAGAGEFKATDGRLEWISNKSGHYKPSTPHFVQTLHILQKRNIDLGRVRVQFISGERGQTKTNYPNVQAFLTSLHPEDDYSFAKMIAYADSIGFVEFKRLLNHMGWHWSTPIDSDAVNHGGRLGVYNVKGDWIPPKVVTHWLRGAGWRAAPTLQSGTPQPKSYQGKYVVGSGQ